MTRAEEAAFERKADKWFKGHRELPNSRNFRFWNRSETAVDRESFRANFDQIRWDSTPPGAEIA